MRRRTSLTATALTAALTVGAPLGVPGASAEPIVYETHNVRAVAPGEPVGSAEHAAIQVPTGFMRDKTSWHEWAWSENVHNGIAIWLDLHPRNDTVRELRAERAQLHAQAGEELREHAFRVNGKDASVRAEGPGSAGEAPRGADHQLPQLTAEPLRCRAAPAPRGTTWSG
jgi:hypothetical protein